MIVPLSHVLCLSAFLFAIGLFGVLTRRNAIGILMSIELILNSANLNFVAFSHLWPNSTLGQGIVLFVIGIAAAGAVVGLALILAIFRHRRTIQADEIHLLKG